jgi:F0F1-type ATP synthase alpha subunit
MFKKMNNICNDLNDINNMGHVFKVSDDIVYARGLLRVQMSEMVSELEKKSFTDPVSLTNKDMSLEEFTSLLRSGKMFEDPTKFFDEKNKDAFF